MTFKGQRAGILSEVGAGSRFVYDPGWTEAIACALPADTREHFWHSGLIPFFEHLGPEGWLRRRQASSGGVADQDDFGLLLNYGTDCISAVGILPFDRSVTTPVHGDAIAEAATTGSRTLSGVQKKWLVFEGADGFEPASRASDPATHIAKFNREDLPTLVRNENLSLGIGREILGPGEITEAVAGTIAGNTALIVKRFDRQGDIRLRLEDFAQILQIPRGREFDGKYQSSYEDAAVAIQHFSSRATIDLARYFRLVVFNLVIGNADAHLKNFSLLEQDGGLRLSPAYDLLNTLIYPYERETALAIGGEKRRFDTINRSLLRALGLDVGLQPRAVDSALDDLDRRFARSPTLASLDHADPGDDFAAAYAHIIHDNASRIFG